MAKKSDKPRRLVLRKPTGTVLFFLSCVLLILTAVLVCFHVFLTAKNIHVQNATIYETSTLMEALDFSVGDNLLNTREEEWSARISVEYPYVDHVTVQVNFPFSVTVSFHETRPLIALEVNGRYAYLDKNLKVLDLVDEPSADLLFLYGISLESVETGTFLDENDNLEIAVLQELLKELETKNWLPMVTFIDFSKIYNIRLSLNNTVTVQLGTSEDLDKKINAAHYVYNDNDPNRKADINVKDYKNPRYALVE